jgi:hypothetical protein
MRRSEGGRQRANRRVVDGWSESAWKSLTVKSLRIGWPEGLRQAEQRLTRSTVQMLLLASVFEDVFPAREELQEVVAEVKAREWDALCCVAQPSGEVPAWSLAAELHPPTSAEGRGSRRG